MKEFLGIGSSFIVFGYESVYVLSVLGYVFSYILIDTNQIRFHMAMFFLIYRKHFRRFYEILNSARFQVFNINKEHNEYCI